MNSRPILGTFRSAGILYLLAAVLLLSVEYIVSSKFPGYSYLTNYVSDLGVPEAGYFEGRAIDSPLAWLMNLGFVAHGILVLAATAVLVRAAGSGAGRWVLMALSVLYALGFATIATFHGSEQSAADGIVWLHFVGGGLLAFSGSGMSVVAGIAAGRFGAKAAFRVTSIALGLLGIVSIVLLAVDKADPGMNLLGEGALERGGLYAILLWQLLAGAAMLWRRPSVADGRGTR